MPHRNICQGERAAQGGLRSLCDSCLDARRCTERFGADMLAYAVPADENKAYLVTECDAYRNREDLPPFKASYWPNLIVAGVRDTCGSCPNGMMRDCEFYARKTELTATSKRRGKGLEITVTCCAPADRLHVIGTPSSQP